MFENINKDLTHMNTGCDLQKSFFEKNCTPILVMDPQNGAIIDANKAACLFYGYSLDVLKTMRISEINVMSEEELNREMNFAVLEERNFFNFQHRLACGKICDVEVTSMPIEVNGKNYLFSMIVNTENITTYSQYMNRTKKGLEKEVDLRTEQLMKEVAFNHALMESMAEGVIACDDEGRLVYFNETAKKWHGIGPSQVPKEDWASHYRLYKADGISLLAVSENPLVRALNGEIVDAFEFILKDSNEEDRNVLTNGRPIVDKNGLKIGAIIVLRDITDQRQKENAILTKSNELRSAYDGLEASYEEIMATEQELLDQNTRLRTSESKYRGIFENIPGGIVHFDFYGIITDLNENFVEIIGSSKAQLLGLNLFTLPNQQVKDAVRKCLGGEDSFYEGHYLSFTSNKKTVISAVFTPIKGVNGEVVAGQGLVFDITEEKQAELNLIKQKETFEALFKNSPLAIVQFDAHHRVLSINEAFSNLFDYKSEEALGLEVDLLVSDENLRNEVGTYSMQVLKGNNVKVRGRRTGKYHREILVDITGVPVIINDEVVGGFAIYDDVTSQVDNHRELLKAKERAEAANVAKSNFLANMSHEIRTPMNGLIGMIQLMEMSALNEEQAKNLELMKISSNALLNVVNDILDYTKIEMGRVTLASQIFNPYKTINEVKALFLPSALSKKLELNVSFGEGVPTQLMGDPLKLQQVLSNIVGNAIKFTHKGGVTVSVKKLLVSENKKITLCFEVEDTGIGIPKSKMEYIFDRFSQVDVTNTRKYGGTGLGLSISRGIVDKMGGKLWVESQVDVGSKFCFTCNFDCVEKFPQESDAFGTKIYASKERSKSISVLIVEDDLVSSTLITQFMRKKGLSSKLASNGFEAVAAFESEEFDLIIMDCQMPEMDGYDATKKIREIEGTSRRTPIIALTAHTLPGAAEKCYEAGMDYHLSKPIEFDLLMKAIDGLID